MTAQSLDALSALCDELRALAGETMAPSRSIIALNELFVAVEGYLSSQGLSCDGKGFWARWHWSYRLLEQLSSRIEACKEPEARIDQTLLRFLDESLLPRLYQEAQRLN